MRKEENAVYQHFLLFPQGSQKVFPPRRQKLSLCDKQLTLYNRILHLSKFKAFAGYKINAT